MADFDKTDSSFAYDQCAENALHEKKQYCKNILKNPLVEILPTISSNPVYVSLQDCDNPVVGVPSKREE